MKGDELSDADKEGYENKEPNNDMCWFWDWPHALPPISPRPPGVGEKSCNVVFHLI